MSIAKKCGHKLNKNRQCWLVPMVFQLTTIIESQIAYTNVALQCFEIQSAEIFVKHTHFTLNIIYAFRFSMQCGNRNRSSRGKIPWTRFSEFGCVLLRTRVVELLWKNSQNNPKNATKRKTHFVYKNFRHINGIVVYHFLDKSACAVRQVRFPFMAFMVRNEWEKKLTQIRKCARDICSSVWHVSHRIFTL